jgi:hypothetical protein
MLFAKFTKRLYVTLDELCSSIANSLAETELRSAHGVRSDSGVSRRFRQA